MNIEIGICPRCGNVVIADDDHSYEREVEAGETPEEIIQEFANGAAEIGVTVELVKILSCLHN